MSKFESEVDRKENTADQGKEADRSPDIKVYIVVTALFAAFTFGVFAPTEFYFSNIYELWFDIYDVVIPLGIITISLFISCVLVLMLIAKINLQAGRIASIVVSVICVCLYIQGNFLQATYDKLGGETIDWSAYTVEGISNVCGWIGMLAIIAVMLYKLRTDGFIRAFRTIMICILLVQITTLTVVSISCKGFVHKYDQVATEEDECRLSQNNNFIVLLLDGYDSRVFDDLLKTDRGDEYKDILTDFTYYRNTLTVFTLTRFSVPQILTGEKFLNQEDYDAYIERAYTESPLLQRLQSEAYDIGIYTTVALPQSEAGDCITNRHRVDYVPADMQQLMDMYYRLIAFRYAPHYLKPLFEFNIEKLEDVKKIGKFDGREWVSGRDPNVYPWGNMHFIEKIPDLEASASENVFRFYHIKGIHHTRDLDEHLNKVDVYGEYGEGVSLEESGKANMVIIDRFLTRLKELGIYEDSTIMIMADHGAIRYSAGGRSHAPLLLVKEANDDHAFSVSEAPVSYDDLQKGFDSLLDKKAGDDIFGVKEGDHRVRTMYYKDFVGKRKVDTRVSPFTEYETDSHAFDLHNLVKTGRVY